MNDFARAAKTAWFGVKNHKNMLITMGIFCIAVFPAFTLISVSGQREEYYSAAYYYVMCVYGVIVSVIAGFTMPLGFFSFLYNRSACDFYNAMPIRRSQYFWGYFGASAVIFIVPWSLTALIHCFITEWGNNLWKPFLLSLGLFFVLYCSMVFAVTFSGSKLCAVLTFIIMNILPVMVVLFPISAAGADTNAYGQRIVDSIMALTPASAVTWFLDENPYSNIIPIQICFGILELIAAFFMFKYRKSESTMALAFPKTRYFYQYGILLLTAMYIDTMFISNGTGYYRTYYDDGRLRLSNNTYFESHHDWASPIFFTLVFVLVAFILTNMVLEKTPRAAFKRIRHYFFFVGGYAVFLLITVPLAINLLPGSVLPFTPKYAAVYAYGYEEITQTEYENMQRLHMRWYGAELQKPISEEQKEYMDEDGSVYLDYEYEYRYYKMVVRDAFVVTDREKLEELEDILRNNPETKTPDLAIFRSNEYLRLAYYQRVNAFPDDGYTEFRIAFVKEGEEIVSDIHENQLDDRITDDSFYSNGNIFVKENILVRGGYASDPSLISKYKDYSIILSPGREVHSASVAETAVAVY